MTKQKTYKTLIIVIAVIILVAVTAGVVCYLTLFRIYDTTTVATVNGVEISAGELKNEMQRNRSDVLQYFKDTYDADTNNSKFWSTDFDGQTPTQYLRDLSLTKVSSYKLQQQLAYEYNIIADYSYQGFLDAMEKENAQRAQKVQNGEAIYGPQSYDKDTYYDYTFSNMVIALKDSLSQEGGILYADDATLKNYYEQIKEQQFKKVDTASYRVYSIAFDTGSGTYAYTKDQATQMLSAVRDIILRSYNETSAVPAAYPEVEITELEITDETANSVYKSDQILYEQSQKLQPDEVSEVFEDMYYIRVLKCYSRESAGYKPYEDVIDAVRSMYNDEKYDAYIEQLCKEYPPEKNEKYEKVTIES